MMARPKKAPRGLLVGEQTVAEAVVLSAAGDIDMVSAPQLSDQVARVLRDQPAALIIDLLRVEFLGSAGIEVLVRAYNESGDTKYAVVAEGPTTQRPLHLLAIDAYIDVYRTVPQALEGMAMTRADAG